MATLLHQWLLNDSLADNVGSTTLTQSGTSYSSDSHEGTKSVDTADGYLSAGTIDLGDTFTISFWVKAGAKASLRALFASDASDGANGILFYLNDWNTSDRSLVLGLGTGSGFDWSVTDDGVFTLDQWNHLALVVDKSSAGGYVKVYYNGTEQSWVTENFNTSFGTNREVRFGEATNGAYAADVLIDDIRIYDAELTDSEISDLYTGGGGNDEITGSSSITFSSSAGLSQDVQVSGSSSITFSSTANISNGAIVINKNRVIVLTDILNEPDDSESLIRLLMYSNHLDIEGIIIQTSYWKQSLSSSGQSDEIQDIIDAYGSVRSNLIQVDPNYPTTAYLESVVFPGQDGYAMTDVGSGKSSPGSDHIISVVDAADDRPVWVCFWGGGNTLAQALYDVQASRTSQQTADFVAKLRVYDIAGQDNAGAWIAETFPDLFYLRCYDMQFGMSDTPSHGWPDSEGGDNTVTTEAWVSANIQTNHGALGAEYPNRVNVWEGDTPSFFHLIPHGLNDPEKQYMGSWGGRFGRSKTLNPGSTMGYGSVQASESSYRPYYMYIDEADTWFYDAPSAASDPTYDNVYATIFRWRTDFQLNFAGRMDWCVSPSTANREPIAVVENDFTLSDVVYKNVSPSEAVELSAAGSYDPKGNNLSFEWFHYEEAGILDSGDVVSIESDAAETCTVNVPSGASTGDEIHIVLIVRNDGTPAMTSYRRVVLQVQENVSITGSSSVSFASSVTLDVKKEISGSSSITFGESASLGVKKQVSGSSSVSFGSSATLFIEGEFTGNSSLSFGVTASLEVKKEVSGNSEISFDSTSSLKVKKQISGSSSVSFGSSADLSLQGFLFGSSSIGFNAQGSLSGVVAILGGVTLDFAVDGDIGLKKEVSGSTALEFASTALIRDKRILTGSSSFEFSASAIPEISLLGGVSLEFASSANLRSKKEISSSISFAFSMTGSVFDAAGIWREELEFDSLITTNLSFNSSINKELSFNSTINKELSFNSFLS